MFNKRLMSLALASALAVSACSNVEEQPLPASTNDPALETIGKSLNDEQKVLLIGYMMRKSFAESLGRPLPDDAKSVGEAIAAQRQWQQNRNASREASEASRKAVADQVNQVLTVAFVATQHLPQNFEANQLGNFQLMTFAVGNKSQKTIKAVKGKVVFLDSFGEEAASVDLVVEEEIKPGETRNVELRKELNRFSDEDKRLTAMNTNSKFLFQPSHLIYDDGTEVKTSD